MTSSKQQQQQDNDMSSLSWQWNAHMKSTAALCLSISSMAYMIISVFPYSGFMAIRLVDGVTEETAGTYAGVIASSFMVGRVVTSYGWGKWADLYGRKFCMLSSLALSCVFTLVFGMVQTYAFALLARFLLGMSNGIMSTAKTAVSELAEGNAKLEKRGMGLVVGMWGWGFLWSPAVGGFLAEPVRQYPNSTLVQAYKPLLAKFPFLLPNLVGMLLCVIAMVAVEAWVPETLPMDKRRSPTHIPLDTWRWIKQSIDELFTKCRFRNDGTQEEQIHFAAAAAAGNMEEDDEDFSVWTPDNIPELRLRRSESGNMLSTQFAEISPRPSLIRVRASVAKRFSEVTLPSRRSSIESATLGSLWNRIDTRVHLIIYWLFGFVQVCGDEAFPLYCISKEGGLGLTESSIGRILSISGLMFGVCQYFVYATIVNRVGLYESLQIGSLCLPIMVLIPFATFFNGENGEVGWATTLCLCTILAVARIFASVFYSSIFIALNRTVPASHRATMNGLQTLGGSLSKGLGPTLAGFLVAFSLSTRVLSPRVGGFFIWLVIGAMGVLNTMAVTLLLKEEQVDTNNGDENDVGSIETEKIGKA